MAIHPIRKCCICKIIKPIKSFNKNRSQPNGFKYECKECTRWRGIQKTFGITKEQYLELFKSQGGVCAICNKPETDISRHGDIKNLAIDHNHKTGVLRGLLCGKCNKAIGLFDEKEMNLQAAVLYLRKYNE